MLQLPGVPPCLLAAAGADALNQNQDPNPNSLPLLGDRDLDQLTFSFNSLLGVGDTPSWLQPPGMDGTQQPADSLSERPFANSLGSERGAHPPCLGAGAAVPA
jgi:hypothetical protein